MKDPKQPVQQQPAQRLEVANSEQSAQMKAAPAFGVTASPLQMKQALSLTKCFDARRMSDAALQEEIKLVRDWLAANPGESPQLSTMTDALVYLEKEADIRAHYDDVENKPHKQAGLHGSNGEMVRTMLEAAGKDPDEWYKQMVSIQLFGQEAKGIRPEFAAKLKDAEKKTCEKLAEENPVLSNPRLAGEFLGINESYKTSRVFKSDDPAYQSMHLFGLAIDINYYNNPWITQKTSKKTPLKNVSKSIDALLNTNTTDGYSYTDAQTKVESTDKLGEIFDGLSGMDKNFELYFSLLNNDTLLEEKLAQTTDAGWGKLDVKKAKKRIKADLEAMSAQFSRGGKKGKANVTKHGLMDLDRRLVMSMGEVGLDWGGKYGDMMHFDMRFDGIGETINKTKGNKKVVALKNKLKPKEE